MNTLSADDYLLQREVGEELKHVEKSLPRLYRHTLAKLLLHRPSVGCDSYADTAICKSWSAPPLSERCSSGESRS